MVTASQKLSLANDLEWQPSEIKLMKPNIAHRIIDNSAIRPAKLQPFSTDELDAFVDKLPAPAPRSSPPQSSTPQSSTPLPSTPDLSNFNIGECDRTPTSPSGGGQALPNLEPLDLAGKHVVIDINSGAKLGLFSDRKEAEMVAEVYGKRKNANIEVRPADQSVT